MKVVFTLFMTFFIVLANVSDQHDPMQLSQYESVVVELEIPANEYAMDSLPFPEHLIAEHTSPTQMLLYAPCMMQFEIIKEVFRPPQHVIL